MINKRTKIDWCDFSWNPVTGCLRGCRYCYAANQAQRFGGDVRLNRADKQLERDAARGLYTLKKPFKRGDGYTIAYPAGFAPTLHEYRLEHPALRKAPANIFVCSMADLFGEWVPDEWIFRVFEACEAAPWHNYLFLTKNPKRYCDLANAGKLPIHDNWWYGTTVTRKEDKIFGGRLHDHTFISVEPLEERLDVGLGSFGDAEWIIVGAETGHSPHKVKPEREWIENIIETAGITHAAVLLKDSPEMREVWGDDLIKEFPTQLQREKPTPVPHCSDCKHMSEVQQGRRGTMRHCAIGWGKEKPEARHIEGRYKETSPLWCPKRKKEDSID